MLLLQRILKLGLVVAFVVGVVMFALAKRDQAPIKAEYDRLSGMFGEMPEASPDHFQILRLPTNEPWHLTWRFRKPQNRQMVVTTQNSFGGGSSSGRAMISAGGDYESIIRFRIDFDRPQMRCFLKHPGGSSTTGQGDLKTAKYFREHWDELEIETVSATEVESFGPDEVVDLVRITVPEGFGEGMDIHLPSDRTCLLIRFGTQEAFDKEAAQTGATP